MARVLDRGSAFAGLIAVCLLATVPPSAALGQQSAPRYAPDPFRQSPASDTGGTPVPLSSPPPAPPLQGGEQVMAPSLQGGEQAMAPALEGGEHFPVPPVQAGEQFGTRSSHGGDQIATPPFEAGEPSGIAFGAAEGRFYREGFEDPAQTTWRAADADTRFQVLSQRRQSRQVHAGQRAEQVQLSAENGTYVHLVHAVEQGRVIEDLSVSLWVHANRPGLGLMVRAVLPRTPDPETGAPLTVLLRGDQYTAPGTWQQLRVTGLPTLLERRQQLLRAERGPQVDVGEAYIDAVVLNAYGGIGITEVVLDDLEAGPLVGRDVLGERPARVTIQAPAAEPALRLELGRIVAHERPVFLRAVTYRGEDPGQLAAMGFNSVLFPPGSDPQLWGAANEQRLLVLAAPFAETDGQLDESGRVSARFTSLGAESGPVAAWVLHSDPATGGVADLERGAAQLRRADALGPRLLTAFVANDFGAASRHLDMLAVHEQPLATRLDVRAYRERLIQHTRYARPGATFWAAVQTELPDGHRRAIAGLPATVAGGWEYVGPLQTDRARAAVQAEQIRLLTYATVSAGYRGVAFATARPLTTPGSPRGQEDGGDRERMLAVYLLNLELGLLEPWLATGTLQGVVDAPVPGSHEPTMPPARLPPLESAGLSSRAFFEAVVNAANAPSDALRSPRPEDRIEAALVRSDYGWLLMPVYYEPGSQFVPGQSAANDVTLTVPGIPEARRVYEVSSAGVRALEHRRVAGGVEIRLPEFGLTGAVLISPNAEMLGWLRAQCEAAAAQAAPVHYELAARKLQRDQAVYGELAGLGHPLPDGDRLLVTARAFVESAGQAIAERRWGDAIAEAARAGRALRLLERACWEEAVAVLGDPLASPYTLSFETLPDHWRLVHSLYASQPGADTLPGGDFEDFELMITSGWSHEQSPPAAAHRGDAGATIAHNSSGTGVSPVEIPAVEAAAELVAEYPVRGRYCLRLIVEPSGQGAGGQGGADIPAGPLRITQPLVRVSTPPVEVRAGQLIRYSGWVRITRPTSGDVGLLIYDSLGGEPLALEWRELTAVPGDPLGWVPFQVFRPISADGTLSVTMALGGPGEAFIDELRVEAIAPRGNAAAGQGYGGGRGE